MTDDTSRRSAFIIAAIVLAVLIGFAARDARGETYFIAPNDEGDDGNSGLTRAAPLQTWAIVATVSAFEPGDTLRVMPGTYVDNNPVNETLHYTNAGDGPGVWSVIMADDPNNPPIFDNEGASNRAFFVNNTGSATTTLSHRWIFDGLWADRYADDSATTDAEKGLIYFGNQKTIDFDMVGPIIRNCHLFSSDGTATDALLKIFTGDTDCTADAAVLARSDSVLVEGCVVENAGNTIISLGHQVNAVIRRNTIHALPADRSALIEANAPYGVAFSRTLARGVVIEENEFAYMHHGVDVRGTGSIVRRNTFHSLTGTAILSKSSSAGSDCIPAGLIVENNVVYHVTERAVDVRGDGGLIRWNTFHGSGEWLLSMIVQDQTTDDWSIYGNVFTQSRDDQIVQIGSGVTNVDIRQNVFFDPQNPSNGYSIAGTGYTYDGFVGQGYNVGGWGTYPALIDSVNACNLRPPLTSGIVHASGGRTVGAFECSDCPVSHHYAAAPYDSIRAEVYNDEGTLVDGYHFSQLFSEQDNFWIDLTTAAGLAPSSSAGVWLVKWFQHEKGRLQPRVFRDYVDIAEPTLETPWRVTQ